MSEAGDRITDFDGITKRFAEEISQARRELGTVNIAVFGNTGVGKSTLLNAVFGRDLAATGTGDSVTAHIQYHGGAPEPLGIYDTPGFETGGAERQLLDEISHVFADNHRKPLSEQIHVVWFVENSQTHRFVDSQANIVTHLAGFGVPVMMILTRVRRTPSGDTPKATRELAAAITARNLPVTPRGKVFLVNALADPEMGDPSHGLAELLDATFAAIPDSLHEALVAAQRLDLVRKRRAAAKIVNRFSLTSGAAGATPVPVADLVLVTGSLTRMFARISAAYGIPFRKKQLARLAAAVLLTGGASTATSRLVLKASGAQLAKLVGGQTAKLGGRFVPVANVVIAAAAGASAALVAKAAGHAWCRVCEYMLAHPDTEALVNDEVLSLFHRHFRDRGGPPVGELTDS
ncbi:50S ribosome-binding GTPase [Stackebrandtia albiflava]|uniref:50S ribosome-binding GTPase n=1 Tax=Stackebrandtia albiflava TaxID=406432 RepID=A0A562UL56_9ACTN|nr:DUF697 domain-containing protein [Stackebrandtia albiflava]TWJ06347.1 50S ribosome-binding GTPase [Stackebrandtia albiflava]